MSCNVEDDGSRCPVSYMIGMNICPDIHVDERAMCKYLIVYFTYDKWYSLHSFNTHCISRNATARVIGRRMYTFVFLRASPEVAH